jgi:predicted secreted protein
MNANSKVEGLAVYEGIHPLISRLAEIGIGVIQMPCAEMSACGMSRPGRTREQYDYLEFREHCARLAEETLAQVCEYQRCKYEIVGLVGVEGSPSCGVTEASSVQPGVHIAALLERLGPLGVRFFAIDESVEGHRVDEVLRGLVGGG